MEESTKCREIVSLRMTGGLVLFFFFLSGAAGLIYEIIWTRLLRLVMGNTVFSITTVLCAFMGGLALGSFLGGKIIDHRNDPLRIYAMLEGSIGIYALFLPLIIKATELFYRPIYQNYHTSFYLFSLIRFLFCGILLLLPTTLMGATLPVLTKFFVRSSDRIGWTVGKLYSVNTFGAVIGSFSAGFLLVPAWGVSKTIYFAAMMNLLICFWVYFLHRKILPLQKEQAEAKLWSQEKEKGQLVKPMPREIGKFSQGLLRILLIGYGLSGFAALVYEIAWTRILSLIIGSSVYAFSLMLTAFIFGLSLGSIIFSRFIDRRRDLILFLAVIEMIIGFSALMVVPFFGRLPLFIVEMILRFSHSFWLLQLIQFGLIFLLMLIPTTMMGAAFPLVSRIYTQTVSAVGSSVGSVYAANTFGAILGSFIGAFILIPWLGIQKTILAAVLINIMVGCGFLSISRSLTMRKKGMIAAVVIIVVIILARLFPGWNVKLISSGAYLNAKELSLTADRSSSTLETVMKRLKVLYHKEGVSTTVTVKEDAQGQRYFLVNGKGDASSYTDMPTQELLAHVPMLLHPHPQSVLVIGLASGVTLGSAGLYPVKNLDCVEISPEAVEASHYFDHVNYHILTDPRVELIIEDGRNHLALTNRTYDVIISEPSNPWIAGISDLFTQEFFQLCRQRLNPEGVACVWLHAYNIADETFRSIVYTFNTVFPYFTIWESSLGVDYLLIGSCEKISLDYGTLLDRLRDEGLGNDLGRINIKNAAEFLTHFVMDEEIMKDYVQAEGIRLHTDDNALVEFSAPRTLYKKDTRIPLVEAINRFRKEEVPFLTYSGGNKKELNEIRDQVAKRIKAKKHLMNGNIYLAGGMENLAMAEFERAISLNPEELPTVKRYVEFLIYAYKEKGQFEQAERLVKKFQALDPDQMAAHYQMGLIHYQNKEWDQALKEFRLALELLESADIYYYLSLVYQKKGEVKEAIWAIQKTLELDPDYVEGWNHLGNLYLAGNDLHLAAVHFEKALDLDPEHVTALINLGLVYTHKGQIEKAIEHFQESLQIDPNNAEAHNNLGSVYLRQGRYNQAMEALNKALAIQPGYAKAMINLGMLYVGLNNHQKAEQLFRQALTTDSSCIEAYMQLGYLHLLKEEFDHALSSFQQMVRLQPDNPQAHYYLGKTYQALGQPEEAIDAWQKAIDLQPGLAAAHLNLGNTYFDSGSFQKAALEWEKAFAGRPVDIPSHLVNLGMFHFRSERYEQAIQAWRKAEGLKGDDPQLCYNIALAYYKKGQYMEAIQELTESLRLQPDNQSARLLLQRIIGTEKEDLTSE
ncbi:MAG: fused MFS/spermidine synthase [bacterium]